MGTHPIFESDFDCLTVLSEMNESDFADVVDDLTELEAYLVEVGNLARSKSGHSRVGKFREKVETSPESNRVNGSFCIKQTEIREERLDSTDGYSRDEFRGKEKEAGRELIEALLLEYISSSNIGRRRKKSKKLRKILIDILRPETQ